MFCALFIKMVRDNPQKMKSDYLKKLYVLYVFAKTSFDDHMGHRLRLFFRFIMCVFFMFVFIEFWRLIARENFIDLPFPVDDVCWYACLTQMMLFLSPRLFISIDQDVRSGDISYLLIRPISYIAMRVSEGIGAMSANALLYYTAGIACVGFYIGDLPSTGWVGLVTALLFLYLGSILHLMYQAISGITALWLQQAEAFYRIYQKILIVLGGLYMPIPLYPDWLYTLSKFTPVYVMMYGPAQFVLGWDNGESSAEILGLLLFWFAVTIFLLGWFYRACVSRLEVNGG